MESSIVSTFLEELVYESDVKCCINDLFERVEDRGILCDASVKGLVWPIIRRHLDVYFVTPESTFNNWTWIDEENLPKEWIPNDSNQDDSPFLAFRLLASPSLRKSVLNLWQHPDIAEIPIRLRILSAIASKRYEGCWQFELIRNLEVDAKTMFQHLKAFYKYDMVVKFNLPVPQRLKRWSNVSSSGVLWLPQSFCLSRIPKDLLQMIYAQQSAPLQHRVVDLLRSVPNHIVLESDLRRFCLSFFVHPGRARLTFSIRTASRCYHRVRRELMINEKAIRVKAWCPQSGRFEPSIVLYGAVGEQHEALTDAPRSLTQGSSPTVRSPHQQQHHRLNNSNSLTGGVSLACQSSASRPTRLPDDESDDPDEAEEENLLAKVKVEVTAINPDDYLSPQPDLERQRAPTCDPQTDPDTANVMTRMETPQEDWMVEEEQAKANQEMFMTDGFGVYEVPIKQQILVFISSCGSNGLLSTQLAKLLGITTKRLMKILMSLESSGFLQRRAQRIGKHFLYKYYPASLTAEEIMEASEGAQRSLAEFLSPDKVGQSASVQTNTSLSSIGVDSNGVGLSESVTLIGAGVTNGMQGLVKQEEVDDDVEIVISMQDFVPIERTRKVQISTDQFTSRLQLVKKWVQELRASGVSDLTRKFAALENSRGPDRKTVQRLLDEAQVDEPKIKKTMLERGRMRGQPIVIYYWADSITETDAIQLVATSVTARRSENVRGAIKRNLEMVSMLKANTKLEDRFPSSYAPSINGDVVLKHDAASLSGTLDEHVDNSVDGIVLRDVHVEKRPNVCSTGARNLTFSQKVLGYYGFIFPVMIRLKIFHRHLVDLFSSPSHHCRLSQSVTDVAADRLVTHPTDTTRDNNVLFTPCDDKRLEEKFTDGYVINRMTIETFLRTIGLGYQHPLVDACLVSPHAHAMTMDSLPIEVYEALTLSQPRRCSKRSGKPSTRAAVLSTRRLLEKLAKMKLIDCVPSGMDCDRMDCDRMDSCSSQSNVQPLGSYPVQWKLRSTITLESFVETDSLSVPEILGVFDVFDLSQLETYWRCLKAEVDRWLHFRAEGKAVPIVSGNKRRRQKSSFDGSKPAASFGDDDWEEGKSDDGTTSRRRKRQRVEWTNVHFESSAHVLSSNVHRTTKGDGVDDPLDPGLLEERKNFSVPSNMPFAEAFRRKNWKAQILISAGTRRELEQFAVGLLKRFKQKPNTTLRNTTNWTLSGRGDGDSHHVDEEANVAATAAVLSAAQKIDQQQHLHLQLHKEKRQDERSQFCTPQHPSSASIVTPTFLNQQTPDVQQLAFKLNIPTDVVIRFLLRYLQTNNSYEDLLNEQNPLIIHTTREQRFRCHLCGSGYFLKRSLTLHYNNLHRTSLPSSQSLYLLPGEYKDRLEKISSSHRLPLSSSHLIARRSKPRKSKPVLLNALARTDHSNGIPFRARRKDRLSYFASLSSSPSSVGSPFGGANGFLRDMERDGEDDSGLTDDHLAKVFAAELNIRLRDNPAEFEDILAVHRLLQTEIRRYDEILILAAAVVAERLLLSVTETSVFQEKSQNCSGILEKNNGDSITVPVQPRTEDDGGNDPLTAAEKDLHQSVPPGPIGQCDRSDDLAIVAPKLWIFGASPSTAFPPAKHRIWKLLHQLSPTHFRSSESRTRFLLQAIHKRARAVRNARVLANYRRLSGMDLYSHLNRLDFHCFSTTPKNLSPADGLQFITCPCVSEPRCIRVLLWRNVLKVILLTPVLLYRPHWASRLAKELRDVEIRAVCTDWTRKGWIAQLKSVGCERKSELQIAFEKKGRRKHCLSRNGRLAMFGKMKEILFANDVEEEMKQLNCCGNDDPLKTDGSTDRDIVQADGDDQEDDDACHGTMACSGTMAFSLTSIPNPTSLLKEQGTMSKTTTVNKPSYRIVPEPISGPYVAAILDELARKAIRLQPEWEDDPQFYQMNEEQTDDRLYHLLAGGAMGEGADGEGNDEAAESQQSKVQTSSVRTDDEETDDEEENCKGEDGDQLELMMRMLEEEKEDPKGSITEAAKKISHGDDDDEDAGLARRSTQKEEAFNPWTTHSITSKSASTVTTAFDPLNVLRVPHTRGVGPLLDEEEFLDTPFDGENRVLSRAIDGGVEKHILTLTGDITSIGAIRYWKCEDGRSCGTAAAVSHSVREQLEVPRRYEADRPQDKPPSTGDYSRRPQLELPFPANSSSSSTQMDEHYNKPGHRSRRLRPFKMFLDGRRIRYALGCHHDTDALDPQLFANRFIKQFDVVGDGENPQRDGGRFGLPWSWTRAEQSGPDFRCVPFYSDDESSGWDWTVSRDGTRITFGCTSERPTKKRKTGSASEERSACQSATPCPLPQFLSSASCRSSIQSVLHRILPSCVRSLVTESIQGPNITTSSTRCFALNQSNDIYCMQHVSMTMLQALMMDADASQHQFPHGLLLVRSSLDMLSSISSLGNKLLGATSRSSLSTGIKFIAPLFFKLSKILSDLLLEKNLLDGGQVDLFSLWDSENRLKDWRDGPQVALQSAVDDNTIRRQAKALTSLLWMLNEILKSDVYGIREPDLESAFNTMWEECRSSEDGDVSPRDQSRLESPTTSNHQANGREVHSTDLTTTKVRDLVKSHNDDLSPTSRRSHCPRHDSRVFSIEQARRNAESFTPTLFSKLLWIIETLRLVVRIPFMDCWRVLSGQNAVSYAVDRKVILGYGLQQHTFTRCDTENATDTKSMGTRKNESSSLPSGLTTATTTTAESRSLPDWESNDERHNPLRFDCPSFIPLRLWALWGTPTELHWSQLKSISSNAAPSTRRDRSFDPDELDKFIVSLSPRASSILFLRCLLTPTLSLLSSYSCLLQNDTLSDPLCLPPPLPLTATLTPSCAWIQLDAHLNLTFISLVNSHIWTIIQEYPGSSVLSVYQQLAMLDFCEVDFLLKCLVEEGMLTGSTPWMLVPPQTGNVERDLSQGPFYFREFLQNCFF